MIVLEIFDCTISNQIRKNKESIFMRQFKKYYITETNLIGVNERKKKRIAE